MKKKGVGPVQRRVKPTENNTPSNTTREASSSRSQPPRIVGIGASAGGLEAIELLFKKMPPDTGIAFVIVQHLDPTRHSSMLEIMSRLTEMPVYLTADGLRRFSHYCDSK